MQQNDVGKFIQSMHIQSVKIVPSGGHFAEMPTVADGRGVGVKNRENLPTS